MLRKRLAERRLVQGIQTLGIGIGPKAIQALPLGALELWSRILRPRLRADFGGPLSVKRRLLNCILGGCNSYDYKRQKSGEAHRSEAIIDAEEIEE